MIPEIIQEMARIDWIIFAVTIIAYILLITDIIKNNGVSQNFYTWFLWGILDSVLLVTTYKEMGADIAIIFGCVIGSFSVALCLSLIKKIRWRKRETRTSIMVAITLAIWLWSKSNLVGIIFAVTSEIIAGIPLMRSSWKNPGSRLTLASYLFFFASYVISIYNSPNWNIENTLFPIAFLLYSIGDTTPLVKKWWNIYNRYNRLKNA